MHLAPDTLDDLDPRIAVAAYDRDALARSIVHIGVGGFHRAHLAAYVDELARMGHTDWGIVGAGVMAGDRAMAEVLGAQQGLYCLVARDEQGADVRVIGSIVDYVLAYPDPAPLVTRVAAPSTQIVSLTVTEGGYPVDDATGAFDPASPNGGRRSTFAAIVEGLRHRQRAGNGGLTILSCDNVIGNGAVTRTATLGVAQSFAPDLVEWIAEHVAFPNSMVDRITPATTADDRRWLSEHLGVEDRWPVMTEPFRQWVVEDAFATGRLPLEDLDVIVTNDVEPYELVKLRLLNAGHSCLAYLARLVEIDRVDEVMADPPFASFMRAFLDVEAGPVVPRPPGIDLEDYKASLIARFSNPAIGDQVERLCLDGSPKFPKFLLPTIRRNLAEGGPIELSALALAGWCQYLTGRSERGSAIEPAPDPLLDQAQRFARASFDEPAAFLRFRSVFGDDLPAEARFAAAFAEALDSLRIHGVRSTLETWVARAVGASHG